MALKQRHKTDEMATNDINIATGAWPTPTSSPGRFPLASKPRKSALGTRLGLLLKTRETTISKIQGRDTRPPSPPKRVQKFFRQQPGHFPQILSLHWMRFKYGLISLISTSSFKRRLPAEVPRTYNWRGKVRCHPPLRFFWVFLLGNKH